MASKPCPRGKTVRPLCYLTGHLLIILVFHNPTGSLLGLYGAMPGFGGLVVLLFAPYIADYLGRRHGTG